MAKCDNCDKSAAYMLQNPGANEQSFCKDHLPWFVNEGNLFLRKIEAKAEEIIKKAESVIKPASKKKVANEDRADNNETGSSSSTDSSQS